MSFLSTIQVGVLILVVVYLTTGHIPATNYWSCPR